MAAPYGPVRRIGTGQESCPGMDLCRYRQGATRPPSCAVGSRRVPDPGSGHEGGLCGISCASRGPSLASRGPDLAVTRLGVAMADTTGSRAISRKSRSSPSCRPYLRREGAAGGSRDLAYAGSASERVNRTRKARIRPASDVGASAPGPPTSVMATRSSSVSAIAPAERGARLGAMSDNGSPVWAVRRDGRRRASGNPTVAASRHDGMARMGHAGTTAGRRRRPARPADRERDTLGRDDDDRSRAPPRPRRHPQRSRRRRLPGGRRAAAPVGEPCSAPTS